ncbi:RNA polymerase sigma factor [Actomonas aquatica]|uniref:Sigma-70 family RNA polymerase sigma factor n=1 Tax=Actomonas aquatica TaxID=2866162 RepID=A0ABZ1C2F5_9BACT|nr:sigma-70 family RNA polymerase sigma factor [Opitutus sp. WL0086]WRQ85699.1 sigma-70 family RNA polymerase sigma factor [Opitutus sp. WL0086]
MPTLSQPSLLTRPSLLHRLRDWRDNSSWEEFHRLYRRFIHGLATRAGLSSSEADEVVQEVLQNVAQRISDYEIRDRRGAFRRWLMNQTRWRIADKFRQRDQASLPDGTHVVSPLNDHCDPMEDVPVENDIVDFWEVEWQQHILNTAMECLARQVPAKHFQAFELYSRQGWPVRRIAHDLEMNAATVYLIAHRLTKRLRNEVDRLRDRHG